MRCAPLKPLVDLTANVEVMLQEYATDGAANVLPEETEQPGFSNPTFLIVVHNAGIT